MGVCIASQFVSQAGIYDWNGPSAHAGGVMEELRMSQGRKLVDDPGQTVGSVAS